MVDHRRCYMHSDPLPWSHLLKQPQLSEKSDQLCNHATSKLLMFNLLDLNYADASPDSKKVQSLKADNLMNWNWAYFSKIIWKNLHANFVTLRWLMKNCPELRLTQFLIGTSMLWVWLLRLFGHLVTAMAIEWVSLVLKMWSDSSSTSHQLLTGTSNMLCLLLSWCGICSHAVHNAA